MTSVEAELRSLIQRAELRAIVLDGCRVKRGDAGENRPGKVESTYSLQPWFDEDDGALVYSIESGHRFTNADEEVMAEIDATFVAIYDISEGAKPGDAEVEVFGNTSVMTHVVPFLRELLSTMTVRLAMPAFYLSLYRPDRVPTAVSQHEPEETSAEPEVAN